MKMPEGYDSSRITRILARGSGAYCTGRRRADQAASLADRGIPGGLCAAVGAQPVLRVRALVALDAGLRRAVLGVFLRIVFGRLRGAARRRGTRDPQGGSVTWVQRFGSDLRVNLHFHSLVLNGVYPLDETEGASLLPEPGAASAAGTVAQGPRGGARIPPVDPFGSLA